MSGAAWKQPYTSAVPGAQDLPFSAGTATASREIRPSRNVAMAEFPNNSIVIFKSLPSLSNGQQTRKPDKDSVIESRPLKREDTIRQAANSLKRMLSGIPGVEYILVDFSESGIDISIVANNTDRKQRWRIYDREFKLLQRYVDLSFEFHLIDRKGSPLEQVVSPASSDLYLRV